MPMRSFIKVGVIAWRYTRQRPDATRRRRSKLLKTCCLEIPSPPRMEGPQHSICTQDTRSTWPLHDIAITNIVWYMA